MIKNIICLLFCALLGLMAGLYYGYLWGRDDVNDRLVVTAFNSGFDTGYLRGNTETTYLLFEDYIKSHPYKLYDDHVGDSNPDELEQQD